MIKSHEPMANLLHVSHNPVGWTRTNNLCVGSAISICCQNPAQDLFFKCSAN